MTTLYPLKKLLVSCLAVACWSVALAACPTTPGRFVTNGAEVTDSQTGLVWQRCSAGQSWIGSTCTDDVNLYNHEQALAYAKSQNTANSPTVWRLPNVKELASLADKGCKLPAIDSTVFPETPAYSRYWSSSPKVGDPSTAWNVDFSYGYVRHIGDRTFGNAVRLVRASQ
jgi:hypothetical protein